MFLSLELLQKLITLRLKKLILRRWKVILKVRFTKGATITILYSEKLIFTD